MIKAICFDADGVIVNPAFQFSRHLHEVYGIALQTTMPFFKGVFGECLTGKKQIRDELPSYLIAWGWQKGVDAFVQTWLEQDDVVDTRMVHVVTQLRGAGMQCYLATNQEQNRAVYMRNKMGFEALFDRCFISCEMGYQKPNDAYYEHIEGALGLLSEEILFWDDSAGHVEAASNRGWQAEVYSTYNEFGLVMNKKYAINWQE